MVMVDLVTVEMAGVTAEATAVGMEEVMEEAMVVSDDLMIFIVF